MLLFILILKMTNFSTVDIFSNVHRRRSEQIGKIYKFFYDLSQTINVHKAGYLLITVS